MPSRRLCRAWTRSAGLRGGKVLLDHADAAADALKSVGAALRGLPPGVTEVLGQHPQLLESIARNPALLDQAIRNPTLRDAVASGTRSRDDVTASADEAAAVTRAAPTSAVDAAAGTTRAAPTRAADAAAGTTRAAPMRAVDEAADGVRVTPNEQAVLMTTATRRGRDLTPTELDTELAIVGRTAPRPITDGPYQAEVALPNGHEWKRRDDGFWCRFSQEPGVCVKGDPDGKLPDGTKQTDTPSQQVESTDGAPPADTTEGATVPVKEGDADRIVIRDVAPAAGPEDIERVRREATEAWEDLLRQAPQTRVMDNVRGGIEQRRGAFIKKYAAGERYNPNTGGWYRAEQPPRERYYFDNNATAEDVLSYLMDRTFKGKGERSLPGYYNALKVAGVIEHENDILNVLQEIGFKGRSEDAVRHAIKAHYREHLLAATTNPPVAVLRSLFGESADFAALRHRYMLYVTKDMSPADRGNFIEDWLERVEGLEGKAHRHVRISRDEMAKQGIELSSDRIPDAILNDTIIERKSISGPLSNHDISQMQDHFKLIGKRVQLPDGSTTIIRNLKYTFPVPEGVIANAEDMIDLLGPGNPNAASISFVITNHKGQTKKITRSNVAELDAKNLEKREVQ